MFRSNEYLKIHKSPSVIQVIKSIKSVCTQRNFTVIVMSMDGKFKHLREDISSHDIYLNIVSRNEHVPEIESSNQKVKKEYVWSYKKILPKKIPDK